MVAERADLTPTHARVLEIVAGDRQELVDLALHFGNTPSFHGQERPLAEWIERWLAERDITSWLQPLTETSANIVGRLPGVADGPSLIFDAHLDTGPPLPANLPEPLHRIEGAWVEDDLLYGAGVINDKGQMAAFLMAARALQQAVVRLRGDLILAGVTFETGHPSVGAHQGLAYPGEGFGTWWLFNRGVTADYALVGETSGFGLILAECGELGLEVSVSGRDVYTPRLERGGSIHEHPSALVRMAHVIPALEDWAMSYERDARLDSPAGTIVPKAQIQQIEGDGHETRVRLDVRLAPGANPRAVERAVREHLRSQGFHCEVRPYQWSRGYVAQHADPLIAAVTDAHRAVFGAPPPLPPTPEISMWRDVNMFNEVGIPSICYGPPRQRERYSDAGNRAMKIDDLVAATQVYALTAINLCGDAD